MTNDDDTIATDAQSREDVLLAMLDAGAFDSLGLSRGTVEDVSRFDSPLVVARVARDCFEAGLDEVVASAIVLRGRFLEDLPESGRGRVVLAFDGWAGDPRPLFEVPEVVVFCRALLFGEDVFRVQERDECARVAAPLLACMFDERLAWIEEPPDPFVAPGAPEILDAAGSLWLSAHAFASDVYSRSSESPTGFVRDLLANLAIDDALRGK